MQTVAEIVNEMKCSKEDKTLLVDLFSPLSEVIKGIEIQDWKEFPRTQRDPDDPQKEIVIEGKFNVSRRVIFTLTPRAYVLNKAENPWVTISKWDDGSISVKKFKYTPEGAPRARRINKLEGFYVAGDDWADLRNLAPTFVKLMVQEGLIK